MRQRSQIFSILTVASFLSLALAAVSCSVNIYKPAAKSDKPFVKKEQALMALDDKDFETAEDILAELWGDSKDNELTQLYAVSILGSIGLDIFSVLSKSMTSCQEGGDDDCSGNDLISRLNAALPDDFNSTTGIPRLKDAIDVLNQAPDKTAVLPLSCFAGGIYMNLVVTDLKTQIATIQTNIKNDIAAVGQSCAGGTKSSNEVGTGIQASLNALGTIASNIQSVTEAVGSCVSAATGGDSAVNDIQQTLTKFYTNADNGCVIPSSQVVSGISFPTCMNSFLSDATALAGDKIISGCEVFMNCSSGQCL